MSACKVFVTRRVPLEGVKLLQQQKYTVDQWDSDEVVSRPELLKRVAGTSAIFCTINDMIDKEVLDAAGPSLKVVATMSVGMDHIDTTECRKRDVFVATTPDIASDSAAELTVTLVLMLIRRVVEGLEALKSGQSGSWKPMWMLGNVTMEKTLGIYGFGRVGFGVARRMKPFGVSKIIYNDIRYCGFAEGLATHVDFDELVSQSDILCICCAVTPQTIGRFDKSVFKKMKPNAILINSSRGVVINQDDLVDALKQKVIAGAALDVTKPEPLPLDHPLMNLKNCIILPHMGTNTWEARISMSENTAKNIIAILK